MPRRLAHFGCISLVRQPLGERLLRIALSLKQRGVRLSFDPNHRALMGPDYPALFEGLASVADILGVSDEDLAGIYLGCRRRRYWTACWQWPVTRASSTPTAPPA